MQAIRCNSKPTIRRWQAPCRRLTLLAAALGVLVAGCRSLGNQGPVSESVATCRQLTQQGTNAIERGDWARAESLLSRAVTASADDVDARRNYAETLLHRGAEREALEQLEEAGKQCAADPSLIVRTGEVYLQLGQPDEAARRADQALAMDPKFAPAWALRGRIATAEGRHRAALADLQRSLSYAPDSYDVNILVAETYRQLNEPQQALVTLQALGDRHSTDGEPAQVLHLQGMALAALGRYNDAVDAFSRAAARERPTPDLLCELANAQWMAGRPAHAQAALRRALVLDPNHAAGRALAARFAAAAPGRNVVR